MEAIINFITGPLNTVAWMYILLPCVFIGGIGEAFRKIFVGAFTPQAVLGAGSGILLGMKATKFYLLIFIPMIVVGATTSLDIVWEMANTFNGLMPIPNFIALFALSGVVAKLTKEYFADHKLRK